METIIALVSFACLVLAWAVLPIRKDGTTTASAERPKEIEHAEPAGHLVAASGPSIR